MKIKRVPKTIYEIKIEDSCCKRGKQFLESGVLDISKENNELIFTRHMNSIWGMNNCMFCGAKIEIYTVYL
jgi:hypothetical protein